MISRQICVVAFLSVAFFACSKDPAGAAATGATAEPGAAAKPAAAAAEVSCDAVVAKLASFNPGSGEPEKKLWTKMCAEMPAGARACVVAAKTLEDSQKCMANDKLH